MAQTRAAAEQHRVTIGFTTGLTVTPAVRELRRRHPDADVHTRYLAWNEPQPALLERRVDAVLGRLPFPPDGLSVTILYEEPRVLLVPVGHRLADRNHVTLDDIAEEPLPRFPDDHWNAFWCVDPRPHGRRAPTGPVVTAMEDKLELIATGQAVSLAPASVLAKEVRPDLTTVPLKGAEPSRVVLATRADDDRPLLRALRAHATANTRRGLSRNTQHLGTGQGLSSRQRI
ncbi:LysR substrate binding domain-containing protein [Streptomyces sp. cf386]|nr:LysR substrate binding domain-containing protein [Streptomyces sp. cf386]